MALQKSIDSIFRRDKKSSKKQNFSQKLFLFIPVLLFGIVMTPAASKADLEPTKDIRAKLVLDTNYHLVVRSDEKFNSKITPGESAVEKEARLQAEALAAQKAKQVAARKAAAVVVIKYNDPVDFNELYNGAGAMFGIDPAILKAIHIVETGASGSTLRANPSGATGPMQFLPSTFRRHGIDGNGDGIKDIGNVADAIYSAAAYLKACGYPDVKKALWGYNPSTRYVNKVLSIAAGFGFNG